MANFSIDEIKMLAQCERDMDSGKVLYVNCPGGRLIVSPEVMEELGLENHQTIDGAIMTAILGAHLASLQARIALDKAAKGSVP